MTEPAEFVVYAVGLVHASVCTALDDEATAARLNHEHPTGVAPWMRSPDETFREGGPNPGPCERHPRTHRHVLFEC
jgi:hypothetical protein